MAYRRYKMLQQYIDGEPQEIYKTGDLISTAVFTTLQECNEGNQKPDVPVPDSYEMQYLQFVSLEDGNEFYLSGSSNRSKTIMVSNDGDTWRLVRFEQMPQSHSQYLGTLNTGEKLYVKGESYDYSLFTLFGTKTYNVQGNIMSLIYGDLFFEVDELRDYDNFSGILAYQNLVSAKHLILPATTLYHNCYRGFFSGCTKLVEAPALPATTLMPYCYASMFWGCTSLETPPQLPATTLAEGCYQYMFEDCTGLTEAPTLTATTMEKDCYLGMFHNCTSLVSAPALPATTLADGCYEMMFYGCTGITTPPALPATTLADNCYNNMFCDCTSLVAAPVLAATVLNYQCYLGMFCGCTSLVAAPELPATTLVRRCYVYMFEGCSRLNSITCLATDISATDCTRDWVRGVPIGSSGTFTKPTLTDWSEKNSYYPSEVSGIPSGWTIINV